MKRLLTHWVIVFFAVYFLNACSPLLIKNDGLGLSDYNLKGRPKRITAYQYQQSGELFIKSTSHFTRDGRLTAKYTETYNPGSTAPKFDTFQLQYDENRFLIERENHHQIWRYKNDPLGRERKSWFYSHPDSLPQLTRTRYKRNKRMSVSKNYLSDGTYYFLNRTVYDPHNNQTYNNYYIIVTDDYEKSWYERDENGKVISSKRYTSGFSDTTYSYYQYDANGNQIRSEYIDHKGKIWLRRYSYVYDEFGNWIKRTKKENGYATQERRAIEYY